jgi:hypothetical protein
MKRVLAVLLLMLVLSFPAFGGHTQIGDYACTCDSAGCIEDFPGECGGHNINQQSQSPNDGTVEFSILIVALMLWLRLKA